MHKMLNKAILSVLALVAAQSAYALGIGYSTFPLQKHDRLLAVESTAALSDGGGIGVQGRYTHKFDERTTFEGGIGMAGGNHDGSVFLTTDAMILPDYDQQPRVSVRGSIENAKEYNQRRTIFSVAPVVSKGFIAWEREVFPYVALPIGVNLNGANKSYQNTVSLSVGVNGHLPIQGKEKILANLETFLNVQNRYSGVIASLSFPWR